MRTNDENLAVFDNIRALAGVDYSRAADLARSSNLIVALPTGTTGVLVGVNWLGNPAIDAEGQHRTTRWRFGDIKPTGHAVEAS